jgi:hypothetical protein
MKVKELIAALKKFDGNLEVYGYCDHGQSPEKVSSPSTIYTDRTGHSLWDEWTQDPSEAEDIGTYAVKAVLL